MNPALLPLFTALAGLALGALFTWLLLRGRAGFEREALAALAAQKAQLDATPAQLSALGQQLGGLAQATPAELARVRENLLSALSQQRQDITGALGLSQQGVAQQTAAIGQSLTAAFEAFAQQLTTLTAQSQAQGEQLRHSLGASFAALGTDTRAGREEAAALQKTFRDGMGQQLQQLTEANSQRLNELRATVEGRLKELQTDNAQKLEAMRATVDEKLHATLEARLGESFKQVSDRLEQVHRGLGEMATLATGVGDLKRVFSNVKTRGGWGEVQLGNLLEQVLTAEQFKAQQVVKPGSSERVDYAIKLPGRVEADEQPVWIPIDAKFPVEDYQRLMDAQDEADAPGVKAAGAALEQAVRKQAKFIAEKYIAPPYTTDFALLFLPTEGLYAEVLRRPGLADALQREQRVILTGPSTLAALLNSLQIGFRNMAMQKRTSEVWQVLGAVKTEFGKFGDVLDKVKKKLDEASNQIEESGKRTRAIQRNLKSVEALPEALATPLLAVPADED